MVGVVKKGGTEYVRIADARARLFGSCKLHRCLNCLLSTTFIAMIFFIPPRILRKAGKGV